MISVEPLAAEEEQEWDEFLGSSPGGLLYHSIRYRDLIREHLGSEAEYVVAKEDGRLVGVLPLMWSEDPAGRVGNSLPFYGSHGGPVAASSDAEAALLEFWDARARDERTLGATLVGNPFLNHSPPEPAHTLTDERISQVTTLPTDSGPDAIMELVESSARRNVRKAERLGYDVGVDQDALPQLARIHRENMEAMGGLAKSEDFFASIPSHFRPSEDYDVWVARADGTVVAALLVFYFNGIVEYFTPAVDHDHRGGQPLALILLRAMSAAAERGFRLWNWGGTWTDQDGVFRFKRKWGAAEGGYRYFVQVNDDALLDSTPEELGERFRHFYVAPYSALRGGPQ